MPTVPVAALKMEELLLFGQMSKVETPEWIKSALIQFIFMSLSIIRAFYCVKIFEADDYPNMMTTNAISYYKTAVTYQGIVGRYYSACVYCYAEKNGVSDSKPYETVSVRAIR